MLLHECSLNCKEGCHGRHPWNVSDAELSCSGSLRVYRRDRSSRGGGVLILADRLVQTVEVSMVDCQSELICIDVLPDFPCRLIVAYSPGTELSQVGADSMLTLCNSIEFLSDSPLPLVVVGDFNCPNIPRNRPSSPRHMSDRERHLYGFCVMASLRQLVTSPTRPASGNIIDILLCSDYYVDPTSVNVSPCPVATDHLGICFVLPVSSPGPIGRSESGFFNLTEGDAADPNLDGLGCLL